MEKSVLQNISTKIFLFFILFVSSFNAQDYPDLNLYEYSNEFWNADTIIAVKGNIEKKYQEEYEGYFKRLSGNNRYVIKTETELDAADLTRHLLFFGTPVSFNNLNTFTPASFTVTKNGFSLGPYSFTDSLDVIYLFSNDGARLFHIGNSWEGLQSIWTTFSGMEQYMIMQDYAITHHGFLNDGKFDKSLHVDMIKERNRIFEQYETEHYIFSFPKNYFTDAEKDSLLPAEDSKFERILDVLELKRPHRKIECYIYQDKYQKLRLSFTPGYGNTFSKAWQNHSIGFGAVEHESIHILFDDQTDNRNTFLNEGVVGYYYSTLDSVEWRKNRITMSLYPDLPVKKLLTDQTGLFWSMSDKAYPASAHFVKFLIDTYGLDQFKHLCTIGVETGFREVYKKSRDDIIDEWKQYVEFTKVVLGPERKITFRVISKMYPDSSVYVTGDHEELGNWNPGLISLTQQKDGSWNRTFSFYDGMILQYKITRGSWDKEAVGQNGQVPSNSVFEVDGDSTITVTVENWKDLEKQ